MIPRIKEFLQNKEIDRIFENYIKEALIEDVEPTEDSITSVVMGRKYCGIYYEDESNGILAGFRLIEPYCFGYGYKHQGKVVNPEKGYVRAFVIKDTNSDEYAGKTFGHKSRRKSVSKSKKVPYWRMFRMDRIRNFKIFDLKFSGYRKLYNPGDQQMGKIVASLPKTEFPKGQYKNR